ncbi:MAG: nuclear transport factor 2 family protein [Anaerolineales bacterium]
MHPNEQLIHTFYAAFAAKNYAAMQACYAAAPTFEDEVFNLKGKEVGAMWHMLTSSGSDLTLTHRDVQADDAAGRAHWEARYTFSTGRKVLNIIDAEFKFTAGRIANHRDRFSFYRWSSQALGPTGLLLGWTPFLHTKVRATARARLDKFIQAHPEYK